MNGSDNKASATMREPKQVFERNPKPASAENKSNQNTERRGEKHQGRRRVFSWTKRKKKKGGRSQGRSQSLRGIQLLSEKLHFQLTQKIGGKWILNLLSPLSFHKKQTHGEYKQYRFLFCNSSLLGALLFIRNFLLTLSYDLSLIHI